jgi:hypothetical protein
MELSNTLKMETLVFTEIQLFSIRLHGFVS